MTTDIETIDSLDNLQVGQVVEERTFVEAGFGLRTSRLDSHPETLAYQKAGLRYECLRLDGSPRTLRIVSYGTDTEEDTRRTTA